MLNLRLFCVYWKKHKTRKPPKVRNNHAYIGGLAAYGYNINMKALISKYYRLRSSWWRWNRILFPSPAELRLIEIMGGKVVRFHGIKHPRTHYPLAWIRSMGKVLRDEKFGREVRCGKYFIDFGNDLAMGLEVDGAAYHRDVVAAFDRDSYLYQRGWRVVHIPAIRLWNEPDRVQREVLKFLYI